MRMSRWWLQPYFQAIWIWAPMCRGTSPFREEEDCCMLALASLWRGASKQLVVFQWYALPFTDPFTCKQKTTVRNNHRG